MKIHSELGKGFKEIVYKDALEVELVKNKIPYSREPTFKIPYQDGILKHKFNADFLVFETIVLEIKAKRQIYLDNFKQTLNYLRASQIQLGIIINFGEDQLKFKRVVCSFSD